MAGPSAAAPVRRAAGPQPRRRRHAPGGRVAQCRRRLRSGAA
nr:hypothetical protein [Tanacetum cinerariifolium]